jgi:hypothetical protein
MDGGKKKLRLRNPARTVKTLLKNPKQTAPPTQKLFSNGKYLFKVVAISSTLYEISECDLSSLVDLDINKLEQNQTNITLQFTKLYEVEFSQSLTDNQSGVQKEEESRPCNKSVKVLSIAYSDNYSSATFEFRFYHFIIN